MDYYMVLLIRLKDKIVAKRHYCSSEERSILQNKGIQTKLYELNFVLLVHPLYSKNLASSHHLLTVLRNQENAHWKIFWNKIDTTKIVSKS